MIVLKISNASEVVASKLGQFIERLTPDQIDHTTVEDQIIKKMIENLSSEGLKGEISAISGFEVSSDHVIIQEGLKVRACTKF